MASGATIPKLIFVPGRLIRVDPLRYMAARQLGLCIESRKLAVAFLLEETESVSAPHEVLDLAGDDGERRLTFQDVFECGRVFRLANCDAVRVPLPFGTDVIAVTKKTFIAVHEIRKWLSGVIASPRGGIEVFLNLGASLGIA